jgi:hypothetical protein
MIELTANIPLEQWRDEFPPGDDYQKYFPSRSAFHEAASPYVCQIVTIRHSEYRNGLWYLRLPEKIATDATATTGSYQENIIWKQTADGWCFEHLPIAGLEGNLAGEITATGEMVEFSLTMRNESATTWSRALAWLCFNHSMAKSYYRYRNFLFREGEVVETPSRVEQHYCVGVHRRDWWVPGEIEPTASLITTRCLDEEGNEFSLGIGAGPAILLGQNPQWPCTDIGLFHGNVSPGETSSVRGKIYFHRGPPGEILPLYRRDFPDA